MTDVSASPVEAQGQSAHGPSELSLVVTQLLKGVVYRETHEKQWAQLLQLRNQIMGYVGTIGLQAEIDEVEGYAYLRSKDVVDDSQPQIPRLVARRTLSFHVSLLLALLRKKLAEHDASSAEVRLILSREQIVEMMRLFMPESSNEARLFDQLDAHINKTIELGFMRRMQGDQNRFEVRRIIKAFVDGQWLAEFNSRLAEYRTLLEPTIESSHDSSPEPLKEES